MSYEEEDTCRDISRVRFAHTILCIWLCVCVHSSYSTYGCVCLCMQVTHYIFWHNLEARQLVWLRSSEALKRSL